ncbi:MAG: hypothetical protein WCJ30_17125, partial [Deltaproteobacteria bacterium]
SGTGWALGGLSTGVGIATTVAGLLFMVLGLNENTPSSPHAGDGDLFTGAIATSFAALMIGGGVTAMVINRGGVATSERLGGATLLPAIQVSTNARSGLFLGAAWRF